MEKALKYLDHDELPVHWEKNILFSMQPQYSDSEENYSDVRVCSLIQIFYCLKLIQSFQSSDDEPREEKDHFVAQLYKFMDDSGTPLNKSPMINNKDVDLYRLFKIVYKNGGYNRVTSQNKWRHVTTRLKFSNNQHTCNQVKLVYKKCLFSYEPFYRTLGCTMKSAMQSVKKSRERALIRGKDRATPVQSPRPDKEEAVFEIKKEEEKPKVIIKKETKPKQEDKKIKEEVSDTNSSGEMTDQSETPGTSKDLVRSKRIENKMSKEKKNVKTPVLERSKSFSENKSDDNQKKEEKEDKVSDFKIFMS